MIDNTFFRIILIGIIVGGSYFGYQKGLFGIASRPIKTVLSFIIGSFIVKSIPEKASDLIFRIVPWSVGGITSASVDNPLLNILYRTAFLALTFILLRFALTSIFKLLESRLFVGVIGRINKGLGLVFGLCISLMLAFLLINASEGSVSSNGIESSIVIDESYLNRIREIFDSIKK